MKKELRIQVWNKYSKRCAYCGCVLEYKVLQVDHIEPIRRPVARHPDHRKEEGFKRDTKRARAEMKAAETIEKLNPSCRSCNIDKHAMTLEIWRTTLENKVVCLRRISNFRIAERYNMINVTNTPIVFHFETLATPE